MAEFNLLRQLRCSQCQSRSICGPEEILRHLRTAGMLRREAKPDWPVLLELLQHLAPSLPCDACGQTGLVLEDVRDDFDDFATGRACEVCQGLIPAERLEVFPDAARCAACATQPRMEDADYCPRCGAIMTVRSRSGAGIARYVSACRDCGYTE